jgi:hypothetical protein
MSRLRIALAAVLIVASVFAALLAADVRSWQDGIRAGDAQFLQEPASARWETPTLLPFHFARDLLGIDDQIAFRRAAQTFEDVQALGCGFDNCITANRARADLESTLGDIARGPDRSRDSAAENMIGILAFADSKSTGSTKAADPNEALANFQSAVQLDPANTDAKFNLEWLQRELSATGQREEDTSDAGVGGRGTQGGRGRPNKGY